MLIIITKPHGKIETFILSKGHTCVAVYGFACKAFKKKELKTMK